MAKRRRSRGMTLVEIMVVIVIIGLVMGVVAVAAVVRMNDARADTARIGFSQLTNALDLYSAKKGRYPSPSDGLGVLTKLRIVKDEPVDPWGRPYLYRLDDNGEPVISTLGRDGVAGGEGPDADLSSVGPTK